MYKYGKILLRATGDITVTLNANYDKLSAGYLFPEIAKRTKAFAEKHPDVKIHRLGIGNTTEQLCPVVIEGLMSKVRRLADEKTYTGYGDEQGNVVLREAVVNLYKERGVELSKDEIFISSGAKDDIAAIQGIFSQNAVVAVSDPVYPVYVDSNVIAGRTGNAKGALYEGIVYMPCTKENEFVPKIPNQKVDMIYLCSPNNPTGAVFTREHLQEFVTYARKNKAVIIFDAAYCEYISDSSLPKSIYEIEGAKECAIEINSFSKSAGFTGVRLGWTIVPKVLATEDSQPGKANTLWNRRQCTEFNGASNIAQEGGLAALSTEGRAENKETVAYYMENARIEKKAFEEMGFEVHGGINAPYLWVKTPKGMKSWEFFDKMLEEAHVVITPGSGFGPSGEGYFRVSAFGHREDIIAAVQSIKENLRV